jgi:hypothetical protein
VDTIQMGPEDVLEVTVIAAGQTADPRLDPADAPDQHDHHDEQDEDAARERDDDRAEVGGDGRVEVDVGSSSGSARV